MLSCCSQPRPNLPVFCHALPLTWSFPSSLAEVLVSRIRREVWRWMFLYFWLKYLYLKCLDRVFLYDRDSTGVPFWAFVNTCKSFNCPLHSDSYLVCAREGMSAPIMASITSNRIFSVSLVNRIELSFMKIIIIGSGEYSAVPWYYSLESYVGIWHLKFKTVSWNYWKYGSKGSN